MAHLSGSTRGLGIIVTGTNSGGAVVKDERPITKDPDGNDNPEEIFGYLIQATNTSAEDVVLTLEWGGTDASNLIKKTITKESGLATVMEGVTMTWPVTIKAYADTANAVVIYGEARN